MKSVATTEQRCQTCKQMMPLSEYYRYSTGTYYTNCKVCHAQRVNTAPNVRSTLAKYNAKAKQDSNLVERHRFAVKKYLHKRRDLLSQKLFPPYDQWAMLVELCDNKCASCGERKPLTVDHIVPITRGGTNAVTNLQPLCKSCNSKKSNSHSTNYIAPICHKLLTSVKIEQNIGNGSLQKTLILFPLSHRD